MSLVFNKENHTYTLDGQPIPSVTKILQEGGLVDFSKVNPDVLDRACKFGDATHLACQFYDAGILNEVTLDENLRPRLTAWKKFLKDTGFVVEAIEEKVVSVKYRFAGRLDRRGLLSKRTVVDLKTGADFGLATGPQLAAYQGAYNEGKSRKDQIKDRLCVLLNGDGTYKLEPYEDEGDFSVFLACLTLRNWRIRYG